MSPHLFLIFIHISPDPSKTAYAYRNCSLARNWAEKADYSECLNLISEIPNYEVSQVSSVTPAILLSPSELGRKQEDSGQSQLLSLHCQSGIPPHLPRNFLFQVNYQGGPLFHLPILSFPTGLSLATEYESIGILWSPWSFCTSQP